MEEGIQPMAFSHGKLAYPIYSALKGRRKVWDDA